MLCRSCKKNVEPNMKHAITANLCPFCGNSIFSVKELGLRKSIGRILIKNGLDNDDTINRIVDDILALATGALEEPNAQAAAPVKVTPRRTVDPGERGSDGLTEAERSAPSRRLTPAPKPTAQTQPAAAGSADAIAAAMRAFEEDNSDPMRRADPVEAAPSEDDDDASGIFFMEASASAIEAERRKGVAQAARQVRVPEGQARTAPAFNRVS